MYTNTRALLIGINYGGGGSGSGSGSSESELLGCHTDVGKMRDFLVHTAGYPPGCVRTMLDTTGQSAELIPTTNNVVKQLQWLVHGDAGSARIGTSAQQPTRLFLHYSGHGTYVPDKSGDEADARDECIVPLDSRTSGVVTDDLLRRLIADALPPLCHLVCVFDCCHSGTMMDLRYNWRQRDDGGSGCSGSGSSGSSGSSGGNECGYDLVMTRTCAELPADRSVVVLSGCMDSETAADAYINNEYQGAMTCAFMGVMAECSQSARQRQRSVGGLVTEFGGVHNRSLIERIGAWLRAHKFKQRAHLSISRMDDLDVPFSV